MPIRQPLSLLILSCLVLESGLALALEPERAAGAASLDAAVAAVPAELPAKKGGLRELTYAFGKKTAPEQLARLAEEALIDRAYFERRAEPAEADFRLALSLDRARSSHQDFGEWQSKSSTYEVSADVGFRWLDAEGQVVSEGQLDGFARISVKGMPRKPDAARAWAQLIDEVVSRAFSQSFEAAAFGNEPPAVGGWIPGEKKR